MTTAIINTDMNIGPFKIPGNGQNMILNNYDEIYNSMIKNNSYSKKLSFIKALFSHMK